MRILGLDIGNKNIGVAISDFLGITARPLTTVKNNEDKKLVANEIINLIDKNSAEKIVAGLPLNMDGTEGVQAEITRDFVKEMEKHIKIPFTFTDERLSTFSAKERMKELGIKKEKMAEIVDQEAAAYILQSYLNKEYYNNR